MNITHEQRVKFLEAHNDLRTALQTIHECGDLWMSDVRKLENLEHLLHSILKFVPDTDDEGRPQYYMGYVLAEEDDKDDK